VGCWGWYILWLVMHCGCVTCVILLLSDFQSGMFGFLSFFGGYSMGGLYV
jgi:hypothetical protein